MAERIGPRGQEPLPQNLGSVAKETPSVSRGAITKPGVMQMEQEASLRASLLTSGISGVMKSSVSATLHLVDAFLKGADEQGFAELKEALFAQVGSNPGTWEPVAMGMIRGLLLLGRSEEVFAFLKQMCPNPEELRHLLEIGLMNKLEDANVAPELIREFREEVIKKAKREEEEEGRERREREEEPEDEEEEE